MTAFAPPCSCDDSNQSKYIYTGNNDSLRIEAKTRDLMEKRRYSRKRRVEKIFKGEKKIENAARLPRKRQKLSLQKSLASLALVFCLKHTQHIKSNKNHDRQLPGTMLVCVFAYLYPCLCFGYARERLVVLFARRSDFGKGGGVLTA